MSENCEYCDKDFSDKKERLEHELNEHEEEMNSHSQSSKKKELNKLEQKTQTKEHNRKKKLQYGAIGLLLVGLVAGGGYLTYQNMESSQPVESGSGNAALGEPVHWHANYRINVCGESRILQNGPKMAHTHGQRQFHLEGVRNKREQATLGWVIDKLGGKFSNTGILGYEEPQSCEGSSEPGNLTVKVNGKELENAEDYVVQDKDNIKIKYE